MKSFYTACAILLIILISVTVISARITKELTGFCSTISNLPDTPSDESAGNDELPEQLLYEWERMKPLLSLTIPHTEMMRVEPEIYNINVYFRLQVVHEYKAARERLLCAVQALLDAEQLRWENIL